MARRRRIGRARTARAAPTVQVESGDGYPASAYDEGGGPVTVLIVGGGLDDGRSYARLALQLAADHRVLRVIRRQYSSAAAPWRPVQISDEVSDVIALARMVGRPCYLFGHSSGGVVALETALAGPDLIDAVAVFEPAIELSGLPLDRTASTTAARRALDAGHAGRALRIFLREIVRVPRAAADLGGLLSLVPRFRNLLIPGQVADQEALQRLGDRLAAYAGITQHVLVVVGTKSPQHLRRRAEMLHRTLPSSDRQLLPGAGHGAPVRDAGVVSRLLQADLGRWISP